MSAPLLDVLLVSLKTALLATVLGAVPATAIGYLLARRDFPGKAVVSAATLLPMVLPPTAVGALLLRLLADDGPLGAGTLGVDLGVLMTGRAAVLAAVVMSVPLVVRTSRVAFEGVDPALEGVARTLGASRWRTLLTVTLPLAAPGLLSALVLGFARAVGEFGATVSIAGNIPGSTSTLASAIWSAEQVGDQGLSTQLMVVAVLIGVVASLASERLAMAQRRQVAHG